VKQNIPKLFRPLFLCLITASALSCGRQKPAPLSKGSQLPDAVQPITFRVVKQFPHDRQSYTEGFVFHNGNLYESSGSPEEYPEIRSVSGIVDLKKGKIEVKTELDRKKYFGEGIVFFGDKLYQLTYKNKIGFIFDAETFVGKGTFTYSNKEGWGLTTDGKYLIMTDGTSTITYLDPDDLSVQRTLNVTFNGAPAMYINEPEFINGNIYANIWTTNNIARIDTATGRVTGIIDLTKLFMEARKEYRLSESTNGIAWDREADRIYVTGKFWPFIYQIDFSH